MMLALNRICWYNGYGTTFLNLAEELLKWNKNENFFWKHDWDSEEHFIWMILVSKFGDWGTSINSGWIDYRCIKNAAQFLFDIFRSDIEQEVYVKQKNGKWIIKER